MQTCLPIVSINSFKDISRMKRMMKRWMGSVQAGRRGIGGWRGWGRWLKDIRWWGKRLLRRMGLMVML